MMPMGPGPRIFSLARMVSGVGPSASRISVPICGGLRRERTGVSPP